VEARVKIGAAARGGHDANVAGQVGVNGQRRLGRRHFEFVVWNLHMGGHAQGMHAGVRAAGTAQAAGVRKNLGDSLLDALLHAQARLLRLPAGVSSAVVGNGQFKFHRLA
jgi:hypothetical protein